MPRSSRSPEHGKRPGFLRKLKITSKKRINRQRLEDRTAAALSRDESQNSARNSGSGARALISSAGLAGRTLTRQRAFKTGDHSTDSISQPVHMFQDQLPSDFDRILDLELDKLNESIGAWQLRKFVVTETVLAFGQPDDSNTAIATIPLWEITTVAPVQPFGSPVGKRKLEKAPSAGSSRQMLQEHHTHPDSLLRGPSLAVQGGAMAFEVVTSPTGMYSGKKFQFRAESRQQCQEVVEELQELVRIATKRFMDQTKFEKSQKFARDIFEGNVFQMLSAFLIFTNFLFNVYQTQIQVAEGSKEEANFLLIDLAFTIVFTVELAVNAYGHWFKRFINNRWSMFDAFVVSVSLLAAVATNIPGISFVRLFRVFRVVRLFGRLEALRKIINALSRSIVPVLNSFIILLLVTCIYAMLAVNFFGNRAPREFGTFAQATLTLFILTSGGGWVDELPPFDDNGHVDASACVFLVSYILVVNLTLLQVSVAVLLDNFVSATAEEEHREHVRRQEENPVRSFSNPMEPILRVLADHFDNDKDLSDRINWIFDMLDEDRTGQVHKDQLQLGLKALPVEPRCYVLSEDVEHMMADAGIEGDVVTRHNFHRILRQQVLAFVQRRVTDVANNHLHDDHIVAQMNSHKMILSMLSQHPSSQVGNPDASMASAAESVAEIREAMAMQARLFNQRFNEQADALNAILLHLGLEGIASSASTTVFDANNANKTNRDKPKGMVPELLATIIPELHTANGGATYTLQSAAHRGGGATQMKAGGAAVSHGGAQREGAASDALASSLKEVGHASDSLSTSLSARLRGILPLPHLDANLTFAPPALKTTAVDLNSSKANDWRPLPVSPIIALNGQMSPSLTPTGSAKGSKGSRFSPFKSRRQARPTADSLFLPEVFTSPNTSPLRRRSAEDAGAHSAEGDAADEDDASGRSGYNDPAKVEDVEGEEEATREEEEAKRGEEEGADARDRVASKCQRLQDSG